eukprot:1667406-Pyramimonas_sp.AAC.1
MDNPQLGHFFGVRKYWGGEFNSPVVEWLNKGLMAVSSPRVEGKSSESAAPKGDRGALCCT